MILHKLAHIIDMKKKKELFNKKNLCKQKINQNNIKY